MHESFSQRLKIAMEARHISASELCAITNVPKSAISQYLSGGFCPRQNRTDLIARALNVDPTWLMGYDVPMERRDRSSVPLPPNVRPVAKKHFPMLGEIACGTPIYANEDHESYVDASAEINADFCLTAKGDSMIGARIHDGDIVFIRRQDVVNNGEIAAVIIGDEATLKRWYYYPDQNKLILTPENPAFEPLVYVGEELNTITCLGKAVCFMSNL